MGVLLPWAPSWGRRQSQGLVPVSVTHGDPGSDLVKRGSWNLLYQVKVQGRVFGHSAPTVCWDISAFRRPYLGADGNVPFIKLKLSLKPTSYKQRAEPDPIVDAFVRRGAGSQ